jgi:hypothetical protein
MLAILEFFSRQNETKMEKIGGYDPFSILTCCVWWAGKSCRKKISKSQILDFITRRIALNIEKNRNSLAIKRAEKKCHGITFFRFFCLITEKSTKPALRSGITYMIVEFRNVINRILSLRNEKIKKVKSKLRI